MVVVLLSEAGGHLPTGLRKPLPTHKKHSFIDIKGTAAVEVGRPRTSRGEIFARTRQLIASRGARKLSVADLAGVCGVTDRTLRTIFVQSMGLTPKQYLQYRKLHLVHRALQFADPHATTVSAVLIEHGEWELGRFAQRYRQVFGELPSHTLRRS